MNRVAKFEKVSPLQFENDYRDCVENQSIESVNSSYDTIRIPKRATSGSAGYDIISPISFKLEPGESIKIPTGLRVQIDPDWVLFVLPKSGLGTKFRLQLDNTCGVIDSDYYGAKNEGHILISITNDSKSGKVLEVPAGKAFVQAIFLPYGITVDDEASGERVGGFGSTGV